MKQTFLFVILFPFLLFSQNKNSERNRTIDSLSLALKNAKHDTTRCNVLLELASQSYLVNTSKAIEYCERARMYSEQSKFLKGRSDSYGWLGFLYGQQGEIPKALFYHQKSLKIKEEIKDKEGIGNSLNNIGGIYKNQGEISQALIYFEKSLKIREEIKDKEGIASSLNNLGVIYSSQGELSQALACYHKCLLLLEEMKNVRGIGSTTINIGTVYNKLGDATQALLYYNKALKISEEIKDKRGIAYSLNHISSVMLQKGLIDSSFNFAKRSLSVAQELGYPENIMSAAAILRKIHKEKNNFRAALEMYSLEILMRDSITNEANKKASIKNQLKYEYEKKSAADSVKNAEEQKVKDAQLVAQNASLKSEKTQRLALYGGLVLVIGFLGFVFNRFRITNKQKIIIEKQKIIVDEAFEKLAEKNKEVMDSIYYARKIQRALITSETYIQRKLKEIK